MKIIVLSDGETWDTLEGCTVWELSAEGAEALNHSSDLAGVSDEHILKEIWATHIPMELEAENARLREEIAFLNRLQRLDDIRLEARVEEEGE